MSAKDAQAERQEVCQQMASLRTKLRTDMHDLRGKVQERTDWRFHVRRHPWITMAGASLVGYWLAPRRKKASLDVATPEDRGNYEPHSFAQAEPKAVNKPGLASKLMAIGATAITRAAVGYVAGKFGETAQEKTQDSGPDHEQWGKADEYDTVGIRSRK